MSGHAMDAVTGDLFDAIDPRLRLYFEARHDPRRTAKYHELLKQAQAQYNVESVAVIVGRDGKRRGAGYQPLARRKSA